MLYTSTCLETNSCTDASDWWVCIWRIHNIVCIATWFICICTHDDYGWGHWKCWSTSINSKHQFVLLANMSMRNMSLESRDSICTLNLIWYGCTRFCPNSHSQKKLGDDATVPEEVPWVGLVQLLPWPASSPPLAYSGAEWNSMKPEKPCGTMGNRDMI